MDAACLPPFIHDALSVGPFPVFGLQHKPQTNSSSVRLEAKRDTLFQADQSSLTWSAPEFKQVLTPAHKYITGENICLEQTKQPWYKNTISQNDTMGLSGIGVLSGPLMCTLLHQVIT